MALLTGNMPSAVHVTRGASYLVIQSITSTVVTVVSFAVLARLITPKEMGIWAVLVLTGGICQTLGSLAIQQAATKFVAENMSRNNREAAASAFYQSVKLTLISASLIAFAVFLLAPELAKALLADASYAELFQILAVDIVLNTGMLQVLGSVMLGLQKFKETAIIGIAVSAILRQVLILTLILWLRNFVGLVIGWAVSDFVAVTVYFWYVYRSLGHPSFNFPIRKLINFAWPLSVSNAASFAQSWFDRALLIAYVPLATLGIYNSAIVAFGALTSITNAMPSALFPAYSAVQTADNKQALSNAAKSATRYTSLVAVPLAFGLLATARPALTFFVGKAYIDGAPPLMILCGIYAFTIFGAIALPPLLLALGETRLTSAIEVSSVVIGLLAALVLLPISGMIGAAIAHGLAIAVAAALTVVVLRRKMLLRIDLTAIVKAMTAGGIMSAIVVAAQFVIYRAILLPVYIAVGALVYLIMLRLLKAISQADIDLLRSYGGNRLRFVGDLMNMILLPKDKRAR